MTHPALLTLLAAPLAPLAVPTQQETAAAEAPVPLISMAMGDLAAIKPHPKDAALIHALSMLEARLAELPSEIGRDMPAEVLPAFEADSIPVWLRLLTMQKRIAVSAKSNASPGDGMPFLFSLAFDETSDEAATQYEGAIKGLLERMQVPLPMEMIQRDGSALAVNMGAQLAPMGGTRAAALLGGKKLGFEMDMNIGGYIDFMESMVMAGGAPPEAAMVFDVLSRMGFDDAMLQVASGCDGNMTTTATIVTGMGASMRDAGFLPETGLTAAHLAPIPADATWASVQRLDMEAGFAALNTMASGIMSEMMGNDADLAAMVQGATGVDLQAGLFGALGDSYGMYASETTGGGGMTSTVMFFSVRDAEALIQTKEQLEGLVNMAAGAETDGYVNIRTWGKGDDEYTTLMFPGLPVPLELTMVIGEEWLVLAATPQAAMGAMGQIAGGGASLATHESIAPLLASGTKYGVSFVDTEHFARNGYGLTSMLLSGVSNGVRSRVDAVRDPGPIMPVYSTFKSGIKDLIGSTELQGDDLVTIQNGDSSIVVQAAMMVGFFEEYGLAFMLPGILAAGAPMIAREF